MRTSSPANKRVFVLRSITVTWQMNYVSRNLWNTGRIFISSGIINEMQFLVGYFKIHIHLLATLIVKPEKACAQSGVYFSTSYFRTSAFSCHGIWTIYNSAFVPIVGVQKSVSYILVFKTGQLSRGVQGKAFIPRIMKLIKLKVGKLRKCNRNMQRDECVNYVMNANQRQFHFATDGQSVSAPLRTPLWSLKFDSRH